MADYSPEQIRQYRQELEKINKIEGELTDQQKERKKFLEAEIRSYQELSENLENNIKLQKEYIKGLDGLNKGLDANILKQKAIEGLLRDELKLLNNKLKLGEGNSDALRKEIQEKQKQLAANKQILEVQNEINKSADISTDLSRKITKNLLKARAAGASFKEVLHAAAGEFVRMADSAATSMLNAQISSIDGLLKAYDSAATSFEKQYALGEVYQDQIKDLYKEMNNYGASIEDVTKAHGELATGFTDFTMLADKQRYAIAETATTMERAYGIAQGDFAKGMQNASKMMGMAVGQAETYQRELAATAEALDVEVAQLASQFASMGPQFAKFGNQAGKAFKDLARISKITGMELQKVLAITNKFDTFEGAAEQAGQLNAALGGNFVNAMDLMMATDPAERFEMIRDAIMSTGLTFDDMSYYQKQFYTNALGLSDVGDLALMMSGNMDMMAGSSNQSAKSLIEQKERAAELMTIQEKLNAALLEFSELFLDDVLPALREGAEFVRKYGEAVGWTALAVGGLSVVIGGYNAYLVMSRLKTIASTTAEIASIAAKEGQVVANLKQAGSIGVLDKALEKQGNTMKRTAKGAYSAAAGLAALGVAVLGIGAGIGLAAYGISFMAESISELNPIQIIGLAISLGILTFGLISMVGAMALLAGTGAGPAAAALLLALGAGMALMGLGAKMAAEGIVKMAEGFSKITLIDGGLFNFAGGLAAVAESITLIAASLATLANPLSFAGMHTLKGLSEIMSAMGDVTAEEAERVQASFVGIKNAINDIDGVKLSGVAMSLGKINVDVGVPNTQMAYAQAPAFASASPGRSQGKIGEILIKFDNDMFEDKVVDLVQNEQGKLGISAVLNEQ